MSRLVSPRFVGRAAEMDLLMGGFDEVAAGALGAVLVGAEAGGGKSRLVREFAIRVHDRAMVLEGGCVEPSEAGLPYAPFVAALRALVRELGVADVSALVGDDGARELAWLLPDFGVPSAAGDPELTRARLFEVILRLFERLAEQRPLVLVVEDLHWAAPSTRDLLSFLVRNLRHARVQLVVTFRSDEVAGAHPLRGFLAELDRLDGVTRLSLPRLSRREVAAQLEGILGHPPEPAVVSAVHERSDGVPLFTEAMTSPDGTVRSVLPGSLRDLLLVAVRELTEDTQQLLRAAAAGGVRVAHALLAAVTATDRAAVTAALRPALAANVLVNDADGYAFRHGLIRQAVEDDLLAGERIQFHRAFAEALESDPSLSPDTWLSAGLALHWQGAGDDERALRAAWQAADEAATGLAYADQLQMLELVLQLWDRAPAAASHLGRDHAGVLELTADAACWAAESARGLALVEEALGELDERRDRDRVAAVLLQRAALRQQVLHPGEVDDLWAALALLEDPTRTRAECLGQLCRALMLLDRADEARPLAEELAALAAGLGDEEFRVESAITLAQLSTRDGGDVVAELRGALDAARRVGLGRLEVLAFMGLTEALEARGEHADAIETGRAGLDRAGQLGQARYRGATIAQNLTQSLTSAGGWDEALDLVEQVMDLDPAPFERAHLLLCRGRIAAARGNISAAARAATELRSLPDGPQAGSRRALELALLEVEYRLADGDPAGAATIAAAATTHSRHAEPRYLWPVLSAALRACVDADPANPRRAGGGQAEIRRAIEEVAANLSRPGPVEQAHAATFAAEASRAGDHPDLAAWDAAADAWAALGQPYPRAYALSRAGAAAAAAGDHDAATRRLRPAAELAAALGAEPLRHQLTTLAKRARVDLSTGARSDAVEAPFRLTEREVEVLRLVAAGHTNREIATDLFISAKTASVHVSNILGKLGVPSRAAAAATAHRLHLFDTP